MGDSAFQINEAALFSDGTANFRIPAEPNAGDAVTVRFRTAINNVTVVCCVCGNTRIFMRKADTDARFDYYEATVRVGNESLSYHFEIPLGEDTCYYNQFGAQRKYKPEYDFCIMPGFHTPNWAKGAVFYQIFTDRFFNGDVTNDVLDQEYSYIKEGVTRVKQWEKYPATMGVREFYGGDLKGVMEKLDYLQDLGIEVIYFNPLFVSPSNHKYDIQDYDYIDPHFGVIVEDEGDCIAPGVTSNRKAERYIKRVTSKENLEASNALFVRLVEEIHKRGMKVIIDGVFNHCGSFNKWLDKERIYEDAKGYEKGAFISETSPYRTFFQFEPSGTWPYNDTYDGWWGHETLPKLNYEDSPKLYEYIMQIAKKWVSTPYNADGWRLDVAADLGHSSGFNHKFWKDFRKNVKEANPEALILAEHYGDPAEWLKGDEWDSVMNYDAFMEPVGWFLTGMEKHSDDYREDLLGNSEHFTSCMRHFMAKFNTQSLQVAMNELSNHDHSRFLTRTNHRVGRVAYAGSASANENINPAIMRQAVVMQMTWPGAPTVYYGDEAGVCGWTDPDNRRTYPWGKEDLSLLQFHREMIRMHRAYEGLKTGSLVMLNSGERYLCYGRFDAQDKFIVAVNCRREPIVISVDAWKVGFEEGEPAVRLVQTDANGYQLSAVMYRIKDGMLMLTLPGNAAVVLKNLEMAEKKDGQRFF